MIRSFFFDTTAGATGVDNLKASDTTTVSRASHTDIQLCTERPARPAYTGCVRGDWEPGLVGG